MPLSIFDILMSALTILQTGDLLADLFTLFQSLTLMRPPGDRGNDIHQILGSTTVEHGEEGDTDILKREVNEVLNTIMLTLCIFKHSILVCQKIHTKHFFTHFNAHQHRERCTLFSLHACGSGVHH